MDTANGLSTDAVIALFDRTFYALYNTRLVHANGDPEYIPAKHPADYHRISFAHGYVASALHEIAHWCIAGKARRLLPDFGYWYAPDGRTAEQQAQFLSVEVKPQALEWMFSVACGKPFRLSTDNLNGAETDTAQFERDVLEQVQRWCKTGLPQRAQMWAQACKHSFSQADYLAPQHYSLETLRGDTISVLSNA